MRSIGSMTVISLLLFACGNNQEKKTASETHAALKTPAFSADSAYGFVARQVAFGPRVPGSAAHAQTGDYLIAALKKFGGKVTVQSFETDTYDGHHVQLRNIMASFNPGKPKRILLAAHWDTRPFADKDAEKKDALFDGANDGASGVGILLETARSMQKELPSVGVDIMFFDGEDWGKEGDTGNEPRPPGLESWWCLGSQYWAQHKKNYTAHYGILLDMAGGKDARFFREGMSQRYAPRVVEKVWNTAAELGLSSQFVNQDQGGIEDDHIYVNEFANIPMVDIVDYQPGIGYFGDYHHSRKDNMGLISKKTLSAVGNVLLRVVYSEE